MVNRESMAYGNFGQWRRLNRKGPSIEPREAEGSMVIWFVRNLKLFPVRLRFFQSRRPAPHVHEEQKPSSVRPPGNLSSIAMFTDAER